MTLPTCAACGQPTACHDPDDDTRPLCAECNVARHELRRDRAAFPTTVRSIDGRHSFTVATLPDGWGVVAQFDSERRGRPPEF